MARELLRLFASALTVVSPMPPSIAGVLWERTLGVWRRQFSIEPRMKNY
jgi:hypothetical protein